MYRKKILFLVISCCLVIVSCSDDSDPGNGKKEEFNRRQESLEMDSKILKRPILYSVLLPEDYNTSGKQYPVVYLLHGYGDNENSWLRSGSIQFYADKAVNEGTACPMIFIMPQGFNTYYVNKYNGNYNYMNMFVQELIPYIDSHYRTLNDRSKRAVMGYSMGGYGAFILPSVHPEQFSTSVALSMSWRTDEQYMAEPQGVWDSQFGSIFGGVGKSGVERLTDYFCNMSPFHFFLQSDLSVYKTIHYFLDCGQDEEQLDVTNEALHQLMEEKGITHEYYSRPGGHNWYYWKGSMDNALKFLNRSFQ